MLHLNKASLSKVKLFSEAREATVENPFCSGDRIKIKCHGVYYRAELYDADSHHSLYIGQRVFMVGIHNNVALIRL